MAFQTPVLVLVFNRPDLTRALLNALRPIQPTHLFIAADGPRTEKVGEDLLCKETLAVFEEIDWPCEKVWLVRGKNLGCKLAVSQAITWFFEHVEYGIILEDDCIPAFSFFTYSEWLLKAYKDSTQIMHIGGNYFGKPKESKSTYYFTKYSTIWGWATWRRAWKNYGLDMHGLDQFLESKSFATYCPIWFERVFWKKKFQYVQQGHIDTWDYQWLYTIWKNNGLCISPYANVVSNIGFRADATHTTSADAKVAALPVTEISTFSHPKRKIYQTNEDLRLWLKVDLFRFKEVVAVTTIQLIKAWILFYFEKWMCRREELSVK